MNYRLIVRVLLMLFVAPFMVSLLLIVNTPPPAQALGNLNGKDVPEADTLLLLGGGLGGMATWLRFQWAQRRKAN